jgi:hypothetical protein
MSERAPMNDQFYVELMGRAAMALKSRRDLLRIVDGGRRFGERTPRPAVDLKLVKRENEQ